MVTRLGGRYVTVSPSATAGRAPACRDAGAAADADADADRAGGTGLTLLQWYVTMEVLDVWAP
ncbi:hypothetical protein V5N34_36640, partial [Streptomyces baarnensis]|uniref:hypothetical protein n=1 Tax=Streptomyces baarnensis TaxID=66872 RepID=UPI003081C814